MLACSRRTAMRLIAGVSAMPLPAAMSVASPEDAGFASDLADRLDAGIRGGVLRGLHAVLVWRAGQLVLERYREGPDESWGQSLGVVAPGADTLHDLRSVTKSVVGLLYGIALDRGIVPPPSARLLARFPEYPDLVAEPTRARLTVEHALTMTLGMAWDERRSYADPANSERAMEDAPDRNRFILDRAFVAEPGERWIYSGGATALIGHLIAKGTGIRLEAFAQQVLFEPLGITRFEWATGRDGVASAASGLRLRPRDLLRIGALVLAGGEWQGRRIVSREWLDGSLRSAIETGDGLQYGRLWWLGDATTPALRGARRWAAGFGNGGQRLWLMPDADLTVVVMSGNYNAPDAGLTPNCVWREIVLQNLRCAT